jgi:hypothetical protein
LGRHLSNAGETVKGRVRFGNLGHSLSIPGTADGDRPGSRRGSESIAPEDNGDREGETETGGTKKKSVLLLGRKVLSRLN